MQSTFLELMQATFAHMLLQTVCAVRQVVAQLMFYLLGILEGHALIYTTPIRQIDHCLVSKLCYTYIYI